MASPKLFANRWPAWPHLSQCWARRLPKLLKEPTKPKRLLEVQTTQQGSLPAWPPLLRCWAQRHRWETRALRPPHSATSLCSCLLGKDGDRVRHRKKSSAWVKPGCVHAVMAAFSTSTITPTSAQRVPTWRRLVLVQRLSQGCRLLSQVPLRLQLLPQLLAQLRCVLLAAKGRGSRT